MASQSWKRHRIVTELSNVSNYLRQLGRNQTPGHQNDKLTSKTDILTPVGSRGGQEVLLLPPISFFFFKDI